MKLLTFTLLLLIYPHHQEAGDCTYRFSNVRQDDYEGQETAISESFECGELTQECTNELRYRSIFKMEHSIENVETVLTDPIGFTLSIGQFARSRGLDFKEERIRNGTFSCKISPGNKATIVIRPRYHKFTVDVEETCRNVTKPKLTDVDLQFPVKGQTSDQAGGSLACKAEPAADISDLAKSCGPAGGLTHGSMYGTVGDAIHMAGEFTANNQRKAISHSTLGGHSVYGLAMCREGLTRAKCYKCLRYLIDKVWSACDNTKEAQIWVNDCALRYSFSRLEVKHYDESFAGKFV